MFSKNKRRHVKILRALWLSGAWMGSTSFANADDCSNIVELQSWLTKASDLNLRTRAQELEVQSKKLAEVAAGRLHDPKISISREDSRFPDLADTDNSAWMLNIMQEFPWPGALKAEEQMAGAEKDFADSQKSEMKLRTVIKLLELLISWSESSRNIAIERENLTEVRDLAPLARSRYSQGRDTHANLLDAEIDTDLGDLHVSRLERQIQNLESEILYMAQCQPVFLDDKLTESLETLLGQKENPGIVPGDLALQSLESESRMRIASARAARLMARPNFTIEIMLGKMDSMNESSLGASVGFSIPLFSLGAATAFSDQEALAQKWSTVMTNDLESARQRSLGQLDRKKIELLNERKQLQDLILPRAKDHLASTYSEFSLGRVSASQVIRSRRRVLEIGRSENMLRHEIMRTQLSQLTARIFSPEEQAMLPGVSMGR